MRLQLFLLHILTTLYSTTAFAQDATQTVDTVGQQITVRIKSDENSINPRVGAGFIWPDTMHIVTALHVVAGDDLVSVEFPSGNGIDLRNAVVERILTFADLALLRIEGEPLPRLSASISETITSNQTVWVFGFPFGTSVLWPRPLASSVPPVRLSDVLEFENREELSLLGFPSTDLPVMRVTDIVPGDSGAPLLDQSGSVVAIGSGGLRGGTVGLGWAIPALHLSALRTSTEDTDLSAEQLALVRSLFMYQRSVPKQALVSLARIFQSSFEDFDFGGGEFFDGFYPVEPIFGGCLPMSSEYTTWDYSRQAHSGQFSVNVIPQGNPLTERRVAVDECSSPTLSISGTVLETVFDTSGAMGLDVSYFRLTTSNPRPYNIHNCDSSMSVYVSRDEGNWEHYSAMCGQYRSESDGWQEMRFTIPSKSAETMRLGFLYEVQNVVVPDPEALYLIDDLVVRVRR